MLHFAAYAPPLASGDERPLRVVEAIEAVLGVRLDSAVGPTGKLTKLADRAASLQATAGAGISLVAGGDDQHPATLFGTAIPAPLAPGRRPMLDVQSDLPLAGDALERAGDALAAIGDALDAYWAIATPPDAAAEIAMQTIFAHVPRTPPLGLPALSPPQELPDPSLPHRLGWINYWPAAAASQIGFDGAPPDPSWRVSRSPKGAWIAQLCAEPLDLRSPAHLDALARAYARFLTIGGRVAGRGH